MMQQAASEDPRPISPTERAVLERILSVADESATLIAQLPGALVSRSTQWILDVDVPADAPVGNTVPDGPLAVQALVPNESDYRGELLVWMTGGRISALEYAYVTDEVPESLPRLDEIEVSRR